MTIGETIAIIIGAINFVALIVIVIILIKSKNKQNGIGFDDTKLFNMINTMNNNEKDNNEAIRKNIEEFKTKTSQSISDSYANLIKIVQGQLGELDKKVNEGLKTGFTANSDSLNKVNIALGKITEAQKNLDSLNDQVSSLNNVLNNSQTRGRFGEITLENLLSSVFGDTHGLYDAQYVLKSGVRPDAVVYLPGEDKLVCIDSKFSFVNYEKLFNNQNKDNIDDLRKEFKSELKKQITKIANDYIIKGETCNYAIMFIPSDGIYAFIQTNEDFYDSIISYARQKNVVITSPSTLQPILANLRMLRLNYDISKNISGIIEQINKLSKDNIALKDDWEKFAKTIDVLSTKKDEFGKSVKAINDRTSKILNEADKQNILPINQKDSE